MGNIAEKYGEYEKEGIKSVKTGCKNTATLI
jgi:hypothetical protein